jgi:hypothetical protein
VKASDKDAKKTDAIDDARRHSDLESAREPLELHVLNACLAEGSRPRKGKARSAVAVDSRSVCASRASGRARACAYSEEADERLPVPARHDQPAAVEGADAMMRPFQSLPGGSREPTRPGRREGLW